MAGTLFDAIGKPGSELLPRDGSARLYPNVLSRGAAERAFASLLDEVPWQHKEIMVYGRVVAQPRLVAWFGATDSSYGYSGLTLVPHAWTPEICLLKATCEEWSEHTFNSALANLYRDGRDGVAWHADDEPELGPLPVIASLSLGADRRFDFRHKETGETIKVVLPSGSLVVMSGECQRHWLHQVPRMLRVTRARINVTFRTITGR